MPIDVHTQTFNEVRRKLLGALKEIPGINAFATRSELLLGLPNVTQRSEINADTDLNHIIVDLAKIGRLLDQGGTRPLLVVIGNALEKVQKNNELGARLETLSKEIESLYDSGVQEVQLELNQSPDPEALVFGAQRDTRLPASFLEGASRTIFSVARLAVPRFFNGERKYDWLGLGTGWIIAPGIIITNHHVIEARDKRTPPLGAGEKQATDDDFRMQASSVEVWFDYKQEGKYHKCQGATLLAKSKDENYDYAVLELNEKDKVSDRAPLPIYSQRPLLFRGSRINIPQHSNGDPLKLAIRNNFYVKDGKTADFIHYQTDTEPGASGSPICDDQWRVIALHHASTPVDPQFVPQEVRDGHPVKVWQLNEAIMLSAILATLPGELRKKILP